MSQTGTVTLVVEPDGTVVGAGSTTAGASTCENGAAIPATTYGYTIGGRRTDVFTLAFDDGVELTSAQIEDGRARLVQDTGAGLVTIELRCRDC